MKTILTRDDLVQLLLAVSDRMIASKDVLCELDAVIGDGDLGVTVMLGFQAIKDSLQHSAELDPPGVLLKCATAFADKAASTFGALMSTMFMRAARAIKGKERIGPEEGAQMIRAAAEGVEQRAKAKLGDKTVLDALIPASLAFDRVAGEGGELADCMDAALQAAKSGVEATVNLRSRAGRSAWLGERTIGAKDPGAEAFVMMLEAANRFIKG